jgi:hypothetical protein
MLVLPQPVLSPVEARVEASGHCPIKAGSVMGLFAPGTVGMHRGHCQLDWGRQRQMPVPQTSLPYQPAAQQSPPVGVFQPDMILSGVLEETQHRRFDDHCLGSLLFPGPCRWR